MFLSIPGVESVSQWAGRAERGADTYGSHNSEYEVRLHPLTGVEQQAVLNRLRQTLEDFPGLLFETNTFLTERVDETTSGYTAPVVVNLHAVIWCNWTAKPEQWPTSSGELMAQPISSCAHRRVRISCKSAST